MPATIRGAHDEGGAGVLVVGPALLAGGVVARVVGGVVVEVGADVPTEEGVAGAGGEEQAAAIVAAATRTTAGRVRWWPRRRGLWRIVRAYPRRASSRVTCSGEPR
jgi:hypothetical protein